MNYRERLKEKKRIVIKIGSSSLTHPQTGRLNLRKLEVLVRELGDLRNQGKDVVLVSSGAIAVGAAALGFKEKPQQPRQKQLNDRAEGLDGEDQPHARQLGTNILIDRAHQSASCPEAQSSAR